MAAAVASKLDILKANEGLLDAEVRFRYNRGLPVANLNKTHDPDRYHV